MTTQTQIDFAQMRSDYQDTLPAGPERARCHAAKVLPTWQPNNGARLRVGQRIRTASGSEYDVERVSDSGAIVRHCTTRAVQQISSNSQVEVRQ